MSYTAPTYVDTKEQAILALASTIADSDKTLLGDGSVNKALDVLADCLAEHDVAVPQTDAGAILALAQYVSGGGGGGDLSTAKVTLNLTMPEGKTLEEATVNVGIGVYSADGMSVEDGKIEVWMISGYTTYITSVNGTDLDFGFYILDTSSPITATGGVSWDSDNERFTVTGDGTISASLMLD